jgi:diguanylate cyclase (GGDEF)-like protein
MIQLMLLSAFIYSVSFFRTRSVRADRKRLEEAVAARSAELARANRELEEAAVTDPLTKVRNRRFFQMIVDTDVERVIRAGEDLLLYLVDIDHFKRINDSFGHLGGDLVLRQVATRLGSVIRASDTLIRWGGEEFLIIARGTRREDGEVLARRILSAIGSEPYELDGEQTLRCTCSVGWSAFPWLPSQPQSMSISDLIHMVDQGLYVAKQSGRNQAVGVTPQLTIRTGGPEIQQDTDVLQDMGLA